MEATIENGILIVRMPLQQPTPSASGKTLVVASSHGNIQTPCIIAGRNVTIGFNAYISAKPAIIATPTVPTPATVADGLSPA